MATVSVNLTNDFDDGFEYSNGLWENSYGTDVINNSNWGNGYRFPGVTVPQGTTITSAILTFYGTCGANGAHQIVTRFYCEDQDNASAGKLSTKTLTTAYTANTQDTAFVPNASYGTWQIDVTTAVQEVISRVGFSSGNAINIIHKRFTGFVGNLWTIFDVAGEADYGCPSKNLTITFPSVALTGTVTTATEADIVTGGKTIILTVSSDTWVTAGATFDAQRQNIINGIDSAQSEAHGWDAEVKAKIAVTDVVRTSATVVTITLDAEASYDITATETITATIPATALTGGNALVASPTFTITPVSAGGHKGLAALGVG